MTYTYRVSNIGDQGSAPFTFDSAVDTLGAAPGGDAGCAPLVRAASDDPGDEDALLEAGETWVFTCSATITETTQNWGCFTFEYANSGGAKTAGLRRRDRTGRRADPRNASASAGRALDRHREVERR